MNRFFLRFFMCMLCLMAAVVPAFSEGNDLTEEKVITPVLPVPDYVERLLEIARGELGYKEESNGTTKYGIWSGDPMAEWCAEFLCWSVHQVDKLYQTDLLNKVFPNYTGTNVGRNWYLKQGRYIARRGIVPGWGTQWFLEDNQLITPNSYIPMPGDWVFFSNNAAGDTNHVAMVEYCAYDEEGKVQVHVIEGNNPSAVARKTYPLDHWAILGYGTVYDLSGMVMRFGNEGTKVKELQGKLVKAGLLNEKYTTGKYGALTQEAIEKLQRQQGLEVNGIANFDTQRVLTALVAKETASPGN